MEPTYINGTEVDVIRYASPVKVGDIVAFRAPTSPNRDFIKRVIAGPGQVVAIDESSGEVRVDGIAIDEPYTKGKTICTQSASPLCTFEIPQLENGSPMIPGDAASPVDITEEDEVCPRSGCYFVMGDNRQNSSDSRQGWLVPADNIIGYVEQ